MSACLFKERSNVWGDRCCYILVREHLILCVFEAALVFLAVDTGGERSLLFLEEGSGDPRALSGGHLVALPALSLVPLLKEDPALPVGSGQHHQSAARDGEH